MAGAVAEASKLPQKLKIAGSILLAEVTTEARVSVARQAGTKRLAWSAVANCCPFCSYMDGKVAAEDSLKKLLSDPDLMAALKSKLDQKPGGT